MVISEPREFRIRADAEKALREAATFAVVMLVTAPIGAYMLARVGKARVTVTATELTAQCFRTVRFQFDDVARVGLCHIRVYGSPAAMSVGTRTAGGDAGVHLCVQTRAGKTKRFMASLYEDCETLLTTVSERVGKSYEQLTPRAFGVEWPTV